MQRKEEDILQQQLVSEESVDGLLELLPSCSGAVQLSTAVHRLGKHGKDEAPRIRRDERFLAVVQRVTDQMSYFRSRQLANALWGFATLDFRDDSLLRKAASQVVCRINEFIPQHLTNTSWAFAKLRFKEPTTLRSLCAEAVNKLKYFVPLDFSLFVWACATQAWKDEEFIRVLCNQHIPFPEFSAQNLANFAWGLATLGIKDTNLFLALGRECCTRLDEFIEQELSNLIWAFGTCEIVDNLLLHHVALECATRPAEAWDPQSVSNLLWAYATLAVKDEVLLEHMVHCAIVRIDGFVSQELANSTWATAMLMYRDEAFLEVVAQKVIRRITPDQTDPIHLAQLMWSFSRFHHRNVACLEKLTYLTLETLTYFTSQSIIDVHDALFTFGMEPPAQIEAKVQAIADQMKAIYFPRVFDADEYKRKLEVHEMTTLGYHHTRSILESLDVYDEKFHDIGREEVRRWRAEAAAIDKCSRAAFHRSQAVWRIWENVTVEASGPPVNSGGLVACRLKHYRGGDAEFRAMAQVALMAEKPPTLEIFVSEVPCLSCLGAMIQFHRTCPAVKLRVSFDRGRQCPKNTNVPYFMLPSTLANRIAFAEVTRGIAPKESIVKGTLTLQEVMDGAHKSYRKKAEAQIAAKSSDTRTGSNGVKALNESNTPLVPRPEQDRNQPKYHHFYQHHYKNDAQNGQTAPSVPSVLTSDAASSMSNGAGASTNGMSTHATNGSLSTNDGHHDRFRAFYPGKKTLGDNNITHPSTMESVPPATNKPFPSQSFPSQSFPSSSHNDNDSFNTPHAHTQQYNINGSFSSPVENANVNFHHQAQCFTHSSSLHVPPPRTLNSTTSTTAFLPTMSARADVNGGHYGSTSRNGESVGKEDECDFGSFKPRREEQPQVHAGQAIKSFYTFNGLSPSRPAASVNDFSPSLRSINHQPHSLAHPSDINNSTFPAPSPDSMKSIQKQSYYPQFKVR